MCEKTKKTLALLALVALALTQCRREQSPPQAGPNIILVSIDTLRADYLNCYGYKDRLVSPHIDALARDGILMEKNTSAAPWTLPSHLSMFTSLGPSAHGVTPSFNDLVSQAREGSKFPCLASERDTLAEVLKTNGYRTAAFTGGGPMEARFGTGQGFDIYEEQMLKLDEQNMGAMYNWIRENRQKRFFLFWHHYEMHAPYGHGDFVDQTTLQKGLAGLFGSSDRGIWFMRTRVLQTKEIEILKSHGVYNRDTCEALYAGCVLAADRWFGQFIDELKKNQLYEDTLIVVTSDHGEEFGDHDPRVFYTAHGHSLYEEQLHIPLIVKLPGRKYAGRRIGAVTRTVDIMPTILDLAGIVLPDNEMQGASLRPLFEQKPTPPRPAFGEALTTAGEKKSVRLDRYKYIFSISAEAVVKNGRTALPAEPESRELFDLDADPKEQHNLLGAATRPDDWRLAADLDEKIREYLPSKPGKSETVNIDEPTLKVLKALGYIKP